MRGQSYLFMLFLGFVWAVWYMCVVLIDIFVGLSLLVFLVFWLSWLFGLFQLFRFWVCWRCFSRCCTNTIWMYLWDPFWFCFCSCFGYFWVSGVPWGSFWQAFWVPRGPRDSILAPKVSFGGSEGPSWTAGGSRGGSMVKKSLSPPPNFGVILGPFWRQKSLKNQSWNLIDFFWWLWGAFWEAFGTPEPLKLSSRAGETLKMQSHLFSSSSKFSRFWRSKGSQHGLKSESKRHRQINLFWSIFWRPVNPWPWQRGIREGSHFPGRPHTGASLLSFVLS